MKKSSLGLLLLITLLTASILGGCAASKNNTTKEVNGEVTDQDTKEAAQEVSEGASQEGADNATADATEKTTIKIAYLPLTHALPLFEEAELLKLQNDSSFEIELIKFGSWPELLDALKAGRVDGASVLIELAMKAKEQGIGLKAAALGHRDGNAIIVANDINTVADLKGKTFAVPSRLSSHNILLNEMLTANGFTIDDVEVIELAPAEMPAALAGGQISGYCVAEPFGAKAVNLGVGKVLYQSGELWEDSLCCGLVLTDDFINNNKTVADSFIREYMFAGDQLTLETAKEVAKDYLGQEEAVLDLSLEWISYNDLIITEEIYSSLVDKVLSYKISDSVPAYEDFIYQP